MTTCAGVTKAGKVCTRKAFAGSAFCKIHDEDYKAVRQANLKDQKEKSTLTLQYISQRVGSKRLDEGLQEEEISKSVKNHKDEKILPYVSGQILPVIRRLALAGSDLRGYPKGQADFPRKVWMIISWFLGSDHPSYLNLAMSCKGLYKVLVEDKVCHYVHPLKGSFRSPLLFIKPVYRILSLEVPEDIDSMLQSMNLPTVPEMLEAYQDAYGRAGSDLVQTQRKAEILIDLIKRMVKSNLGPNEDLEEIVKGGGIFNHLHSEAKFSLTRFPHPFMVRKEGISTFLIVDARKGKELDRLLTDHLLSFDGRFLIQLMRI